MRPLPIVAAALLAAAMAAVTLTSEEVGQASETHDNFTGNWKFNHHARFGEWETFCRTSVPGNPSDTDRVDLDQHCYMRLVDYFKAYDAVDYSPSDVSLSAFVSGNSHGMRVEFRFDDALAPTGKGAYLIRDGKTVWTLNPAECFRTNSCVFTGPSADALIDVFSDRSAEDLTLVWNVADGSGHVHHRNWEMTSFAGAHRALTKVIY